MDEIELLAQNSKDYNKMRKEQQEIIKLKETIQICLSQQNYADCVRNIFELQDQLKHFVYKNKNLCDIEEKSAIELFKHFTQNYLTELITNLASNYDRLFAFCFELRK